MISKTLTVVNPSGLHLRPAGVLSQAAMRFKCDVIIECGDKRSLQRKRIKRDGCRDQVSTEINLICDGEDEGRGVKDSVSRRLRKRTGRAVSPSLHDWSPRTPIQANKILRRVPRS